MRGRELLKQKIDESGLKVGFIAKKLGITTQGFYYKMNGRNEFKASEIKILKDILHLSEDEITLIFLE